jgi:hypothetical protein
MARHHHVDVARPGLVLAAVLMDRVVLMLLIV